MSEGDLRAPSSEGWTRSVGAPPEKHSGPSARGGGWSGSFEQHHHAEQPRIELDESPFELQPVEGLPLTKAERTELKRMIDRLDDERAAASSHRGRPSGAL